jgi:hypothetical protein
MADRIEREIEEILKKIDDLPEGPKQVRGRKPPARPPRSSGGGSFKWLSHISMRQVMFWALVAVVVAFFFRGVPGGYWLLIGSIIVFATAFFLSTRGTGPASNVSEKRWRGQPMDLSEPSLADKVKSWWRGRRRS